MQLDKPGSRQAGGDVLPLSSVTRDLAAFLVMGAELGENERTVYKLGPLCPPAPPSLWNLARLTSAVHESP